MSDHGSAMTSASCRGFRRSTTRMSRAAFRGARCSRLCSSFMAAAALSPRHFSGSGGGFPKCRPAAVDPCRDRPYKITPTDRGGLDVAGESETAFEPARVRTRMRELDLGAMTKCRSRRHRQEN